jgi:serine phosphatase RsbU (regulator of sigma subunit)
LLERQLKKYLKGGVPDELTPFLTAVDAAYSDLDHDKKFIEKTLEISLKELDGLNASLQKNQAELEGAFKTILESIEYATRLQKAQLPDTNEVKKRFADFDVYWHPRDQIGGDFWWITPIGPSGKFSIIAVDCTGHGVPGAMLALLASNILGRIYSVRAERSPTEVLQRLDELMRIGLHQNHNENAGNDGCDAAIVQIDSSSQKIIYAGCGIDLYVINEDGQTERHLSSNGSLGYPAPLKTDPQGVEIHIDSGQTLVMSSDGIFDQIGFAPSGRKMSFGVNRFSEALQRSAGGGCTQLIQGVVQGVKEWQGGERTRDDLMMLAFKLAKY